LHALRDSRGDGNGVRRLPRARFLLKKSKEWWESAFDAHYLLEYGLLFTPERDRQEISRIIELLGLPNRARVLDVPCGQGRHAHLLAEAGYDVDGLDYSGDLLSVARKRGTAKNLRYVRGDMRKLPAKWTGRFDAVLNLFTSFGFFAHPNDDARVIREFARVLRPGGMLVWHGGNRDGVMARFLERDWWTTSDGTVFAQEREFDSLSGVLTVHSIWRRSNKKGTREHRLRLYTPTRLAELCAEAGLVVEQAFDGFHDRSLRRHRRIRPKR
jgi:SAM-dependent methyltransferase